MSPRQKRIEKELEGLLRTPHEGYSVGLKHDDIYEWTGFIRGVQHHYYENGTFGLHIQFTDDYPDEPPKIHFTTKIYHPNVDNRTGAISCHMLGKDWNSNITIEKILMSLRLLLTTPELESAVDVKIANEYANDKKTFEKKAREWTEKYATEN
ncbi:UBC-like protein, partial [Decorospora gaudefroyi]